jgi:hypothetical protein
LWLGLHVQVITPNKPPRKVIIMDRNKSGPRHFANVSKQATHPSINRAVVSTRPFLPAPPPYHHPPPSLGALVGCLCPSVVPAHPLSLSLLLTPGLLNVTQAVAMQNIVGKYGFLAERIEVDSSMNFQQQVGMPCLCDTVTQ